MATHQVECPDSVVDNPMRVIEEIGQRVGS